MTMLNHYKQCVLGQFEASLWMLHDCIQKCPQQHWCGPPPECATIGKYEFWHVAYHTIMFVDLYLSLNRQTFQLRPDLHPAGWSEFDDEYPSRQFQKQELLDYLMICVTKLRETLAAESEESLNAPSGFARQHFSRAELYLNNMRHVMHHTGQLSAFLRRLNLDEADQPRWGFTGWR